MSNQMHSVNQAAGVEYGGGALDAGIARATNGLLGYRQPDGDWCFELEADATIPAEYILLEHFLGEIVDSVRKLAIYLRTIQGDHGGWPLFHGGEFNISASSKPTSR